MIPPSYSPTKQCHGVPLYVSIIIIIIFVVTVTNATKPGH